MGINENKKIGIYKIENTINGEVYIGQSVDILHRWICHKSQKTNCTKLKRAFNKYGIDNFSFEIIDELPERDKELLDLLEISYIEYFNSFDNGYNCTLGGDTCKKYLDSKIKIAKDLERKRIYRLKNTDKIREMGRTWRSKVENKAKKRAWNIKNKDKINEQQKIRHERWYKKHREEIITKKRLNRDKINQRKKEWYQKNKDRLNQIRREKKLLTKKYTKRTKLERIRDSDVEQWIKTFAVHELKKLDKQTKYAKEYYKVTKSLEE